MVRGRLTAPASPTFGAARLGAGSTQPTTLMTIDVDGTNPEVIGTASGAPDDWVWGDIAWSSENWILFVVGTDRRWQLL